MKHLTSRIAFTAAVVLVLLPVASPGAEPPQAPDGKSLAGKLLSHLGLDQAKRAQLESGDVVTNGLSGGEQVPEEIAAAGAMLLVKAPEAGAVVDAFLHAETFLRIHRVQRYQALAGGSVELAAFSTMPLPDLGRLQELVKAPARNLNLNTAEAEKLKSLSSTASDLETRVRSTLAEIFARLDAYAGRVSRACNRTCGSMARWLILRSNFATRSAASRSLPMSFPASWMPWERRRAGRARS
jgi:hypothetical protein